MISTPNRHGCESVVAADFEYNRISNRNPQREYLANAQVQQVAGPHLAPQQREFDLESPVERLLREFRVHRAASEDLANRRAIRSQKGAQACARQQQLESSARRLHIDRKAEHQPVVLDGKYPLQLT